MADRQYAKFFMGTMIKLSLFIVFCAAASYLSQRLLSSPFDRLVPAAAAVVITWFFLMALEENKRSFFAKGYFLQNFFVGGVWGFGAAVAGPLIGLAFKVREFNWFPDWDINEMLLNAAASVLFLAIVVYGYFFHILLTDFGAIPAIIISSVVYGLLSAVGVASGTISHEILLPAAAYYAIIGIGAGMLILGLGDMRSAVAFLFIHQVMSGIAEAFTSGGRSFETDMGAPIMAVLCAVSMYLELRREREQKKKSYNA